MLRDLCDTAAVKVPDSLESALRDVDIKTVAERVEREMPSAVGRREAPEEH